MLATVRIHASLIGCITHILVIESCTRGKHHVSPYRGQRSRYSLCVCVCVVRVCVCVCERERERAWNREVKTAYNTHTTDWYNN